jgi:Tol biopolymer transport system component
MKSEINNYFFQEDLMKRKMVPHLITVIAVVTMLVLGLASAEMSNTKKDSVDVAWDEGRITGVTRITNDGLSKNWVRVSPDGTKLLYTEASRAGYWQIVYLRDANNPAKTPLVGEVAFSPSWYEDSNRFLYVSHEAGAGRLVRSSVSGGGKTYISRAPIGQHGDDFPLIKDGLIVFTAYEGSRLAIVTVKENGTETTFLGEGRSPSWHPHENKLLFIRNESNPTSFGGDIFELDVRSGQFTQIYSDPKFLCYEPSYSPDGKKILFTKGTAVRTTGTRTTTNIIGLITNKRTISDETIKRHIFVMNADGTNVSPVSSGNATVISPSWGANGEVFCLVSVGKGFEIYKLRIRGD